MLGHWYIPLFAGAGAEPPGDARPVILRSLIPASALLASSIASAIELDSCVTGEG